MFIYETVNEYLEKKFKQYSNNEAIVYPEGDLRYTYAQMGERINLLAKGLLSLGGKRNDHIAILAPSSPDWIMFFLAITKIGAVPVCLNDKNTVSELEYTINHSDSVMLLTSTIESYEIDLGNYPNIKKVIILTNDAKEETDTIINLNTLENRARYVPDFILDDAVVHTKYNDILTIQYTSGTTGLPKAVMSVHYKVLSNVKIFLNNFDYNEHDKILSALPLYHVMGCLFTGLLSFMKGSTLVLISQFKTRNVLDIIENVKCTSFHGVPTMYNFMLNYAKDYNITSLKKGMIAGDYCKPSTIERIEKELGIQYLFPAYGQSEGVGFTQIRMDDPAEKRRYTVGRPVEGVEIRIVDENNHILPTNTTGEIIVKMPFHMAGYYKNEAATNQTIINDWIYTGDLGQLDDDGYLVVKGRKKEIIIRGGENISPIEIEDALKEYKRIKDVAVVGVPDDVMGEEVAAFIIVDEESKDLDEDILLHKIHKYTQKTLSKFKQPKYTRFVTKFPMTSSGKVQKYKLAKSLN